MDQVNPKGGALVKTSVSHRSEDQLHKEAERIVKSFPHMTIEQAKMGLRHFHLTLDNSKKMKILILLPKSKLPMN